MGVPKPKPKPRVSFGNFVKFRYIKINIPVIFFRTVPKPIPKPRVSFGNFGKIIHLFL